MAVFDNNGTIAISFEHKKKRIALQVDIDKQHKSSSNRVSAILKSAGYKSTRMRTKEFPDGYYWSMI